MPQPARSDLTVLCGNLYSWLSAYSPQHKSLAQGSLMSTLIVLSPLLSERGKRAGWRGKYLCKDPNEIIM
jgi:hypothetical protein